MAEREGFEPRYGCSYAACMSKAEKYQRFAEACLKIASAAKDDKIKAALMHMAQVWLRLAVSRPKELEKDEAD
jgi:hypothetical protein